MEREGCLLKVSKQLLACLVVVLFVILCAVFLTTGKNKKESIAAPLELPKIMTPPPPPQASAKATRVQAIQDTVQWERDPFTLPSFLMVEKKAAEKQRVPLKLVAIFDGARGRTAIIDNEIVKKGDLIAGERIVDIGKESVTLVLDGSKRVITLKEPR